MRKPFKPRARTRGLVVRDVAGDTIAYDLARHRAHYLDGRAARILRACDGGRTAEAIALHLGTEPTIVQWTLRRLDRARLLEPHEHDEGIGLSRRQLLKRLGAGLALPVIVSIVAPTPAAAASCRGIGQSCTSSAQCCPNNQGFGCCRDGFCANGTGNCA